jgi:hypothetical protein
MLDRAAKQSAASDGPEETMDYILQTVYMFVRQLEQAHEQNVAEAAAEQEKTRRKEEGERRGSGRRWGVSHDSLASGVSLPRGGRDTGIGASGQVEGGVLAEAMKVRRGMMQQSSLTSSRPQARHAQQAPQAVETVIDDMMKTVRPRELREPASAGAEQEGSDCQAHAGAPEWSDDEWAAE